LLGQCRKKQENNSFILDYAFMLKKVLLFSVAYSPFFGGAELAVKEITDRIEDIEFDLITLRFDNILPKVEKIGNITVYRIGFALPGAVISDTTKMPLRLNKFFYPFIACLKALKLHREKKYDVIWSVMAAFAGFSAIFFKTLNPRIPYLLTLQEGDPIDYILNKVKFIRPFFNRIFIKADFIQSISAYLADWARQMGYQGEIKIVPNAVDIAHFSKDFAEERISAVKGELRKKKGDVFIITTSRLVKKNAIDDVIKALIFLPANVRFIILGIGHDEQMLRNLAKKEGVDDRIVFLGHIGHEDLPIYLQAADIFIRPSLSEGLGSSFLEAMAAGIPVIATPVGGIVDFLFDPEKNQDRRPTGLFCQVHNPKSVAEKIKVFIENDELKDRIVANAKEMIFTKYDWNVIALEMSKILKNLSDKDISKYK
jgi:glycosyltransferase involved in cell wall biosynthesis